MRLWIFLVLSTMAAVIGEPRRSDATEEVVVGVGHPASDVSQRLRQPVSLSWTAMPLRRGIERIAERWSVGVLLDRRIDPGQSITIAVENVPLGTLLQRVAAHGHAAMAVVGSVVYIGPEDAAARLPTMWAIHREMVRRLPTRWRRRWLQRVPGGWGELSEPRRLCQQVVGQVGGNLVGDDRVPHDLWAAASLPQIPRCDRLTFVLAQFDLGYEIRLNDDEKTAAESASNTLAVRIVPWSQHPRLERRYAGGSDPARRAAFWRRLAPEAEIVIDGDKIVVRGSWADHERLLRGARSRNSPTPTPRRAGAGNLSAATRRYDLRVVDVPARQLIEAVARKLGRSVAFDDGLSPSDLQRSVSVDVRQKSADQLLHAVVEAAGLRLRRSDDGDFTVVRPSSP